MWPPTSRDDSQTRWPHDGPLHLAGFWLSWWLLLEATYLGKSNYIHIYIYIDLWLLYISIVIYPILSNYRIVIYPRWSFCVPSDFRTHFLWQKMTDRISSRPKSPSHRVAPKGKDMAAEVWEGRSASWWKIFKKSIEILKNLNSSSKIGPVFVEFPEAIKVDGGVVRNAWIRRLGFCPFHGRAIELIGFTIPKIIIHGWYQPSNYGRFTMRSSQKPEIRRNFCRMRNWLSFTSAKNKNPEAFQNFTTKNCNKSYPLIII